VVIVVGIGPRLRGELAERLDAFEDFWPVGLQASPEAPLPVLEEWTIDLVPRDVFWALLWLHKGLLAEPISCCREDRCVIVDGGAEHEKYRNDPRNHDNHVSLPSCRRDGRVQGVEPGGAGALGIGVTTIPRQQAFVLTPSGSRVSDALQSPP